MSLREDAERARQEYLERLEQIRAQIRAVNIRAAWTLCRELFGREPDSNDGYNLIIDGVELRFYKDGEQSFFRLVGHCPICQEECLDGRQIASLWDLGIALHDFSPSPAHRCRHTVHASPGA